MWRDFLTLTRKEQVGVLSLFLIIVALLLLFFVKPSYKEAPVDQELLQWLSEVRQLNDSIRCKKKTPAEYFLFNPDSATHKQLLQLGFSEFAAKNLINYRKAGGKVNNFEKLSRIYGMDSLHLKELIPYLQFTIIANDSYKTKFNNPEYRYNVDLNWVDSSQLVEYGISQIVIADILKIKKNFYFKQRIDLQILRQWSLSDWQQRKDTLLIQKKPASVLAEDFKIELNAADTAELVLLKGIGKIYARRIVYYRYRLGGFYELKQLGEVDGISPVVLNDNVDYIAIDTALVKKININTASLKRMKDHPYMDFYMARDIFELRKKHTVKLDEVIGLPSFAKADIKRIRQYFY